MHCYIQQLGQAWVMQVPARLDLRSSPRRPQVLIQKGLRTTVGVSWSYSPPAKRMELSRAPPSLAAPAGHARVVRCLQPAWQAELLSCESRQGDK